MIAHEFAHVKNRDILVSSIAAMVAGSIAAIANILQFSLLFGGGDDEDSPLGFVGTLAAIIVAPIAATLLQLGVSRQREYLADATARRCSAPAKPLADALETLERGAQALPMNVNPADGVALHRQSAAAQGVSTLFVDASADRGAHPPPAGVVLVQAADALGERRVRGKQVLDTLAAEADGRCRAMPSPG